MQGWLNFYGFIDAGTEIGGFIEDCEGCFADNRGGLSFTVRSVPEPASLALLGLGLLGVDVARRRVGA